MTIMELIDKDALVAEIERRINNHAGFGYFPFSAYCLEDREILSFINTIEAKGVDLNEEIESYFKGFGKFPSVGIDDCIDIAKHFFELGVAVSNPITATDRGIAEEIIVNLKRIEQDYHINLTGEMEWLRNQVKKEKEV